MLLLEHMGAQKILIDSNENHYIKKNAVVQLLGGVFLSLSINHEKS